MKQLIASGAARIAAGIQSVGANFDFEVLSLPGGGALAVLLWLYATTMATVKRAAPQDRAVDKQSTLDARRVECRGRLPSIAGCLGCGCG